MLFYLLASLLLLSADATAAVEYDGYTNPAGTEFPIVVYDNVGISVTKNGKPLTEAQQKAYFDTLKLAGFNVELWDKGDVYYKTWINKWAPYIRSLGMNTIISSQGNALTRSKIPWDASTPDSILLKDNWNGLRTVISNYRNDPYVWGYWVLDEPSMTNLHKPAYELNTNEVAIIPTLDMVNRFKGSKVAFVNLAAAASEDWIGHFATDNENNTDIENYENFLDHMVDVLDLKLLAFDFYPVIHDERKYGPGWAIKPSYYNFMDCYGRYCRDKKIPVWLTMLSVEHCSYDANGALVWEYPEITAGLLRMQAMNGLAFGMKGLIYWVYGAENKMSGTMQFKSALYDISKMATTPAWNYARNVNYEVAQYAGYLKDATYDKACLAYSDSTLHFDGFEKFSGSFECVDWITYNNKGVLLSHFTSDDGDYLAVVNQDYVNSQRVTISFNRRNVNRLIISYQAEMSAIDIPEIIPLPMSETVTLNPGGMVLYKY